jgi:hypothetical protein
MLRTALRTTSAILLSSLLIAGCGSDDEAGDDTHQDHSDAASEDDAQDDADDAAEDESADDEADDDAVDGIDSPGDWVLVTDEPSGISVAMPEEVAPEEQQTPSGDGELMTARSYFTLDADGIVEVGFNVLDLDGGTYDLEAGLQGVVDQIEGTVERSDTITVHGNEGVEAEVSFGPSYVTTFQLIALDDHVLQPLVSSEQENSDHAEEYFEQLIGSIDLG